MTVLETDRLVLRQLTPEDAGFILGLLNEPSFLRFVGDKGVRTTDDARRYIESGPMDSYRRHGFGLYLVSLKATGQPMGICGLLKRDWLPDADVGFAFVPRFWSKGYARESASAVLRYGRDACGLGRILAITSADNGASIALLEKLGFRFERLDRPAEGEPEVKVFASEV